MKLTLPTLLLISDNSSIRYWIKSHLDTQFFILEAKNASSALSHVHSSTLDLILLDADIEKPLALCKELKAALHDEPIPILLITGRLKKSFRSSALRSGISGFLSTQLDAEEFKMRVAEANKAQEVREKVSILSSSIPKEETLPQKKRVYKKK